MAAYAAVISLKHTINALLNSSSSITLSSTLEMLESAYNQSTSLQQALESLNDFRSRKRVDAVDGQIRDAAHRLEDVLEFHELNSQEEEEVRKEIMSFIEAAKKMEKEYIEELSKPLTEEEEKEENDAAAVINVDFGVEMVGHSTLFNTIRKQLLKKMRPIDSYVFAIIGEKGSGRTAYANDVFKEVGELYECCAWVTLGDEQLKEVVIRILEQVGNNEEAALLLELAEEDEKMICEQLYKALEHRRYMIVLDDVRSKEVLDCLLSSFPKESINGGSLVLVTTNQAEISQLADGVLNLFYVDQESYQRYALHMCNFLDDHVSPELEEAGRKIIGNCRCLPIPFFKTVPFLYKSEKTVEEWSKIAEDREHPIFMVEDEISEVTHS